MAKGVVAMDPLMVVATFWPLAISFCGGFLIKFFRKKRWKFVVGTGANIIALVAFAQGEIPWTLATSCMLSATLFGAWLDGAKLRSILD